jgi:serine/threonine protein phosphatase PrpC
MSGKQPETPFVFNHTVVGVSHVKAGKPCQDYSLSEFNPEKFINPQKQYAIAVVADGHGSSDYFRSDRGSRMACEAAKESVRMLMQDSKQGLNTNDGINHLLENPDKYMDGLKKSIITLWRNAVAEDYTKEPFTQEELNSMSDKKRYRFSENEEQRYVDAYGTTLIVIVKHPRFWFGLHIGDGKCVACYPDSVTNQPIPWDSRCFLNITTSLCDENALEYFRHSFHEDDFPDAIYIATDGVDDSFGTDEHLYDFYQKLTKSFAEKGAEKTVLELKTFLPQLTEKGSGDDISIAGITL